MTFDAATFLSAMLGGGFVGVVVAILLKSRLKEIPELRRELSTLRDDRVAKMERSVERLAESGCSVGHAMRTSMQTVIAQNNEIFVQLKQLNRESSEQAAVMKRNSLSLTRLHSRLDDHVEKHHDNTKG